MKNVLVVVIIFILFISCTQKKEDCDKIAFNDKIENVSDSLKVLKKIFLEYLPNDYVKNFYVDIIYKEMIINNNNCGQWSLLKSGKKQIDLLKKQDLERVICLFNYLMKNNISGIYRNHDLNKCVFIYNDSICGDNRTEDMRELIIKEDFNNTARKYFYIIDEKCDILLIAPNKNELPH